MKYLVSEKKGRYFLGKYYNFANFFSKLTQRKTLGKEEARVEDKWGVTAKRLRESMKEREREREK